MTSPIAVEQVSQSCGCIAGEWIGMPVESRVCVKIAARFLTKGIHGILGKTLHAKFAGYGTVELVEEGTIPEAITYSAQPLRWQVGTAPPAQRIVILGHSKEPPKILSVSGGGPAFAIRLETLQRGGFCSLAHALIAVPSADIAGTALVLWRRSGNSIRAALTRKALLDGHLQPKLQPC